ncbi:MAG: hypothetical protein JOY72_02595 [Actinobacteria bacterium]|nr:hypothetical protein [Actinomycetota bacterium]
MPLQLAGGGSHGAGADGVAGRIEDRNGVGDALAPRAALLEVEAPDETGERLGECGALGGRTGIGLEQAQAAGRDRVRVGDRRAELVRCKTEMLQQPSLAAAARRAADAARPGRAGRARRARRRAARARGNGAGT